jgi:hypothetical protein
MYFVGSTGTAAGATVLVLDLTRVYLAAIDNLICFVLAGWNVLR